MNIKDELDSLRQSVEGCTLVAFADIDAKLVLVSSSETRASRESLDALCAEASTLFGLGAGEGAGSGLSGSDTAMVQTGSEIRLFLRDPGGSSDVLCCIGTAGVEVVEALYEGARDLAPRVFEPTGEVT